MAKIYKNILELTGRTPLLETANISRELNLEVRILAKLECFNPAGSVKDRAVVSMIEDAEEKGILKEGTVIIEPTSGNTGIGIAAAAAAKGYKAILVMPETMSVERRKLLLAYGAQLVLTEGARGMKGAIEKASELQQNLENSIILGQFVNSANPAIHRKTTGPEIWEDAGRQVDIFIAGIGTGGTITGAGGYLKEQNPDIQVIAVEPAGSPVLSGEKPGPHGIQGIGAGFVPQVLDVNVYDQVLQVQEEAAYRAARLLAEKEGVLVGVSSGAAMHAAIETAAIPENKGKTIVVILPDTGERYLSTPLFGE